MNLFYERGSVISSSNCTDSIFKIFIFCINFSLGVVLHQHLAAGALSNKLGTETTGLSTRNFSNKKQIDCIHRTSAIRKQLMRETFGERK